MHIALYRKWRPKQFSEVVGQEHITSILKYEIAANRPSHAYLFCGSRGTGKTTCAKLLAKALNCLDPKDGEPCGVCDACRAIENGTTTDVLEMDAASNNGVEYVRDIREEVMYTPSDLKKRVYIIDEVHMLSQSAFNALLKTLEEPPEYVVFILATTELQKIPATIVSRCQRFDFKRIPTRAIADRLLYIAGEEGYKLEDGAAFAIGRLSEGGMRDAVSMLELCSGDGGVITEDTVNNSAGVFPRTRIADLVSAIADKNLDAIFSIVDTLAVSSMDFAVFLSGLIGYYRDMLVMRGTKTPARYLDLTEVELKSLKERAGRFSSEKLLAHHELLAATYQSLQKANNSARITVEMTLVRLCDDSLDASPVALLSRIAALEDRMMMGGVPVKTASPVGTAVREETIAAPVISDEKAENLPISLSRSVPSPTEEKAPEAPAVPSAPSGVRILQSISSWTEIVKKFERLDRGVAAFLSRSKAFKVKDTDEIVIRVPDKFSLSMVDKDSTRQALFPLFNSYVPGAVSTAERISITLADGGDQVDEQPIDSLTDFS